MDMTDNPNYYIVQRPYKSKYICTGCRKSFKRKMLAEISANKDIEEIGPKCPECGQPTNWIGPKFRAPKSNNVNAWTSIKVLHEIGLLNFIGWAKSYVEIPETKKSLNDFLAELKASYEWNIKKWATIDYSKDNKNQIKYFPEAIKKIDKHLERVK